MKIFWFSFSYKGKNNGVCVLEARTMAESERDAKLIAPDNDDMFCCEIQSLSDEHKKMEFNRLYSPEEMNQFGYVSVKSLKHN